MDLLSLLHIVNSWWFPVLAFLAPILLYGLYKLASRDSNDYVFSGGGGSYSITTTISPPSEWPTTEKMRATYYTILYGEDAGMLDERRMLIASHLLPHQV